MNVVGRKQHLTLACAAWLAALAVACSSGTEPVEVVVSVDDAPTALSSATILVDYSQSGAKPAVRGNEPECAAIVPNVTADFSDDRQGQITVHVRAPQGLTAPVDLAACRMVPDAPSMTADVISARLRVSLIEAADTAGKPVEARRLARAARAPSRAASAEGGERRRGAEARSAGEGLARPGAHEGDRKERRRLAGEASERGKALAERGSAAGRDAAGADSRASAAPAAPGAKGNASRAPAPPVAPPSPGSDAPAAAEPGESEPGRADANEESDTDPAAVPYEVTFGVTNASGTLGALQFDVNHSGSAGGFAGAAGSAKCAAEIPGALATFNDRRNGALSGAIISLDGIPTPGRVATCTFKSRDTVRASDFSVRVVDAADPEGKPPGESPQMAVVDVRAMR